jgi:hypothetical protein
MSLGLWLSRAVVPNLFWVAEHLRLEKTLAEHFGHIRTFCGTLKSLRTQINVAVKVLLQH